MLRDIRQKRRMSIAALSRESGISYSTLKHWERGHTATAAAGQLKKVAAVLDCKIDDLV